MKTTFLWATTLFALAFLGTAKAGLLLPDAPSETVYRGHDVKTWQEPVRSVTVLRCGKFPTVTPLFCDITQDTGVVFSATEDFNHDGRKERAEVGFVVGNNGGVYSALIFSDATTGKHIQTLKMPGRGSSLVVQKDNLFWNCDGCMEAVKVEWRGKSYTLAFQQSGDEGAM